MTDLAQLIDFDGNFMPMENWLRRKGFQEKGFDYSVLTVLGCQSTGKSTLLNKLFGTTFEVLDESQGRHQTTKGLWIGTDKENSTIIIDVEGTDSKERGEDRMTFEHRTALFSLAVADVVIVNMWYHDLGRYTASNYGLLKTVLGVNLQLFQQQKDTAKTVMMFVIRDYSEERTPLNKLNEMIQVDIRQIWKETTKPERLRDSTADDFFIFKVVGLPSMFFDKDLFSRRCDDLRTMWFKELRPKSYSLQIPADGFGTYCQNAWQTILQTSELDIPSQKEMLATFRCEELKNAALTEALTALPRYLDEAQEGKMDDFTWSADIVEKALALYDKPACRYQRSVYLEKWEQLLQQLQPELQKVADAYLTHMRHRIASKTSTRLESLCNADAASDCWVKFAEVTNSWRNEALTEFDQIASSMVLAFTGDDDERTSRIEFDSSVSRQALVESLDATLAGMREKQQNSLAQVIGRKAGELLGSPDKSLSGRGLTQQDFWNTMNTSINNVTATVMNHLGPAWFGLHSDRNVQTEHWREYARAHVIQQLRLKLDSACEGLENHVVGRFNEYFNKKEAGVPRRWQETPVDELEQIYSQARARGFDVMDIFEAVGQQLFGESLLSADRKKQVRSNAEGQMQTAKKNARLTQDEAIQAREMQEKAREKVVQAKARAQEMEARAREQELQAKQARAREQETEARAREQELQARAREQEMEARAREQESQATQARAQQQEAEARAREQELQATQARAREQEMEARAREQATQASAREQEMEARVREQAAQATQARARAQEMEARTRELEAQAQARRRRGGFLGKIIEFLEDL